MLLALMKWRIVATTLPFALLAVLLSYLREEWFHIAPVAEFSRDLTAIITGTVLIIGFMLAGVISDHKECERIPGQLAAALEVYTYAIDSMVAVNGECDSQALRRDHLHLATTIEDWLLQRAPRDPCNAAMRNLNINTAQSEVARGLTVQLQIAMEALANIRGPVGRIGHVRSTDFIPTGYKLLQGMVTVVIVLVIFSGFNNTATQFAAVGILTLVLLCLTRLIYDLDNPFDYKNGQYSPSSNEVNPESLVNYLKRLKRDLHEGF